MPTRELELLARDAMRIIRDQLKPASGELRTALLINPRPTSPWPVAPRVFICVPTMCRHEKYELQARECGAGTPCPPNLTTKSA